MTSDNAVLDDGMQVSEAETYRERELKNQISRFMEKWGGHESVQRFVRKYHLKLNTCRGYLADLDLYFDWLQVVGVTMNPDELIMDNLRCVFESGATEVGVKTAHTDLLDEYANIYLVEKGLSYASRHRTVAAIREFYRRNNAALFGDFTLADGKAKKRLKTPSSTDIRTVLKALPIYHRAPLVLMWQTAAEPAAILSLKWGDVNLEGRYLKLDFAGRKKHKLEYFTLAGKDSIVLLKIWRQKWTQNLGREPTPGDLIFFNKKRKEREEHGPLSPGWLNECFKETAMKLHREGLISNGARDCWHIYALRHSFKTEAEHAGVKSGVVEFLMGHNKGISWTYDNRDQLHPGDFEEEYAKVEPFLSLDYTEALSKREIEARNEEVMKLIRELQAKVDWLTSQQASSGVQDTPESR
jgi:integrase